MKIETKYSVGDTVVPIPEMSVNRAMTNMGEVKRIKYETSGDVTFCRYMCSTDRDTFLGEYREDQLLTVEEYELFLRTLETLG